MQPPDPGALKVEIDAFQGPQHTPLPGSHVRLWGISLDDIGQAANLNGCDLVLRGGMGKGLPLANPTEAGILIQGNIQQAFANWIGTTMTLDLIIVAGSVAAGTGAAQNFLVNWSAGQTMATMLQNTLSALFPNAKLNINISNLLKLSYTEGHFAATWGQFAQYLIDQSRRIMNTGPALTGQFNTPNNAQSTYPGVQVHLDGGNINVFDGTQPSQPKQVTIYDLVGQPTWIGPKTIQVTCVMRGDLSIDDFITLPPTRAIVTAASLSPYSQQRQDILFQGTFQINKVHHVGNYKDPGALSWVTVFDCFVVPATASNGNNVGSSGNSSKVSQTPVGGPSTGNGTNTSTPATAASTGLGTKQTFGPSTGIGTGNGQTLASTASPNLNTQNTTQAQYLVGLQDQQTTTGNGLKQSTPAPSLGQSISEGSQYNPGM
jgi:hypothetical protein